MIEVTHLMLLSIQISKTGVYPDNVLGHGADRFKETLLGAAVTMFMSISDKPKSTNAKTIWKQLHPKHSKAIDRVWSRKITPGETVMKLFRDQAGAHGDRPEKYFAGKLELFKEKNKVLIALDSFLSLSVCLLKRQAVELPNLASEIETALFDIELQLSNGSFNRKWLREMLLIDRGTYRKIYC